MAIGGVLMVTGSIAINALLQSIILQIFTYGILGGVGTSLVLSQAEAVLNCHFPSQPGLVQGVCNSSMSLGYFGMPLLLNGLISIYGSQGSLLLQAGVVLQAAIGAALLLPPGDDTPQLPYYGRPRSYSLMDDIIELVEMQYSDSHSGRSPLLSQRSWKNPGTCTDAGGLSSPIMQVRHKNINGVDILPEIPEEDEDSEESNELNSSVPCTPALEAHVIDWDEIDMGEKGNSERVAKVYLFKKNKKSVQRHSLSKWESVHLQSQRNLENDTDKSKSINGSANVPSGDHVPVDTSNPFSSEGLISSLSPSEHNHNRDYKHFLPRTISERLRYYHSPFHRIRKILNCGCCDWYCRLKFYLAILNLPHRLHKILLRPLWIAVKEPKFIPAFCLHTTLRVNLVIFSTLTPSLVWNRVANSSFQDTAFTVSVAAFAWLCFLLISPCFSDVKPRKQKYIYFVGHLVSICGLWILSTCSSQSCIIMSCAIFGLGHGAMKSSGPIFLEQELGISKFLTVQGSLDGVSGCLVLLLATAIGVLLQHPDGINQSIIVLATFQTFTGLLWTLTLAIPFLRRIHCQLNAVNCWPPPESDFMTTAG
ncbi:uncharacterized protein [Anabrus simplex]